MKVCIIHARPPAREVIARALRCAPGTDVVTYAHCEDILATSLDYDVFIVYNNFGPRKMNGIKGTAAIRDRKPEAYIIGVSSKPYNDRRFLPAGANAFLLRAGNEIAELVEIVRGQLATWGASELPSGAFRESPAKNCG